MSNEPPFPDDESPDPLDEDFSGREARGFVPELLRKAAVAGLGAIFMTEEGVRNLAGQMKVPKEALAFLLAQAEKTKDDVGRVISEEVRRFLQSDKLREEFLKLLAGMSVEVTAQIRLVPDPKAPKGMAAAPAPEVSVSLTGLGARRNSRKKKE